MENGGGRRKDRSNVRFRRLDSDYLAFLFVVKLQNIILHNLSIEKMACLNRI